MFNWFAKKVHDTVDGITSSLMSMVQQLEELAVRKLKEAEDSIAQALHLQTVADAAKAEAAKATKIIDNVKNILNHN